LFVCFLLSNCTNFFFFHSLQQLLAMNQQAKAASQQATMLTAEALCQTTLTQCFNPPVAAVVPASVSGYRMIKIDCQQYLLNDTTNHLLVVPTTSIQQKVSEEKAQSLSPIDLAWDSFEEMAPSSSPSTSFVTPSAVKKGSKRPPVTTNSNVVLSKNNGSDDKIIYVAHRRKKRKLVPLPASQSSEEVQVIEQVELNLEVESQDLPRQATLVTMLRRCLILTPLVARQLPESQATSLSTFWLMTQWSNRAKLSCCIELKAGGILL
jgi:hypothetical protein